MQLYNLTPEEALTIEALNASSKNKMIVCCHGIDVEHDLWISFDDVKRAGFTTFDSALTFDAKRIHDIEIVEDAKSKAVDRIQIISQK